MQCTALYCITCAITHLSLSPLKKWAKLKFCSVGCVLTFRLGNVDKNAFAMSAAMKDRLSSVMPACCCSENLSPLGGRNSFSRPASLAILFTVVAIKCCLSSALSSSVRNSCKSSNRCPSSAEGRSISSKPTLHIYITEEEERKCGRFIKHSQHLIGEVQSRDTHLLIS